MSVLHSISLSPSHSPYPYPSRCALTQHVAVYHIAVSLSLVHCVIYLPGLILVLAKNHLAPSPHTSPSRPLPQSAVCRCRNVARDKKSRQEAGGRRVAVGRPQTKNGSESSAQGNAKNDTKSLRAFCPDFPPRAALPLQLATCYLQLLLTSASCPGNGNGFGFGLRCCCKWQGKLVQVSLR